MTKEDIMKIDGFKDKSAQNIIDTLKESRKNLSPLKALLMSACFNNFGEKKLQAIMTVIDVSKYLNQNHLSDNEVSELCAKVKVKTMTENFLSGCKEFKKSVVFMNLLQESLGNIATSVVQSSEKKEVKKVVFTGFRPDKELQAKMKEKGWEMGDNVSKTTQLLVVKEITEMSSTKAKTAQSFGIKIITKEQFVKQL